jgi:hypothetical protein
MILETIIGALVPIGVEGIKQAVVNWTGGVKPTTVAEQIQMDQQEVLRLEAVAKLDTPIGQPSQWVIDLRASARYIGALAVIACGISTLYIPTLDATVKTIALEAANIAFGFLFGSRIVANFRK